MTAEQLQKYAIYGAKIRLKEIAEVQFALDAERAGILDAFPEIVDQIKKERLIAHAARMRGAKGVNVPLKKRGRPRKNQKEQK
jgi:hypothetical protein